MHGVPNVSGLPLAATHKPTITVHATWHEASKTVTIEEQIYPPNAGDAMSGAAEALKEWVGKIFKVRTRVDIEEWNAMARRATGVINSPPEELPLQKSLQVSTMQGLSIPYGIRAFTQVWNNNLRDQHVIFQFSVDEKALDKWYESYKSLK